MDPVPPKIETTETRPADLQTLMCVMDLAEQSRNKLAESGLEENPEQLALNKEALAQQLREHYRKQGMTMPEEAIAEAVDEFTASQSRFQNTLTGFNLLLARLYIKRVLILSVFMVVALVAGVAALQIARQDRALRRERAAAVRQRAGEASRRLSDLRQTAATEHDDQKRLAAEGVQLMARNGGIPALEAALRQWSQAENDDFTSIQRDSGALEEQLGEIKTRMEADSAPPVKVSRKEEGLLETASQTIEPLDRKVQAGHARLKDERLALRDWAEERDQNRRSTGLEAMGPVERQSFLTNLKSARDSLEAARYEQAEGKLEENGKLLAAMQESARREGENQARINETGGRIKALLDRLRSEAADAGAKSDLESRIKEEQLDLLAGDLPALASKLKSLQQIEAILNASFHLRIGTGAKTGVQRTLKGSSAKQWYIIVEATDDNNNRVPFPVASVESGKTATVSTWGEAVPDNLMQEIRKEKTTRGVISNREFGVKRRGALKIDYTRIERPIGEITSW